MGTVETKKDTNLTSFAMETLLVVGNLGGVAFSRNWVE
jgi:hypothetical protein